MKSIELAGKKVLVVGLARSGVAAANFLISKGARVTVTDLKDRGELQDSIGQLRGPVSLALGGHEEDRFTRADLIVLSPGVPADLAPLAQARQRQVPILPEIELAYRFLCGRFIGVTGSNGKTTTTTLIGDMFKAARRPHVVAGNIGNPLVKFAQELGSATDRTFILELSSFQLETIDQLCCDIAVILNITPDHLDRHPSFDDYVAAKTRIFRNQRRNQHAVLNADDPITLEISGRVPSQCLLFSRLKRLEQGVFVDRNRIEVRWKGPQRPILPLAELPLKGDHNVENALAATAVGILSGLSRPAIAGALRAFKGVEHRLELVREVSGIDFYNDSKATNVDSAAKALGAFDRPLILIMGGLDKGGDFTKLRPLVKLRVRVLILIGQARDKIASALGDLVPTVETGSLAEAVQHAYREARTGEVVLLAPACASFDMFRNFEERGRIFKEIVHELPAGKEATRS